MMCSVGIQVGVLECRALCVACGRRVPNALVLVGPDVTGMGRAVHVSIRSPAGLSLCIVMVARWPAMRLMRMCVDEVKSGS